MCDIDLADSHVFAVSLYSAVFFIFSHCARYSVFTARSDKNVLWHLLIWNIRRSGTLARFWRFLKSTENSTSLALKLQEENSGEDRMNRTRIEMDSAVRVVCWHAILRGPP